MRPEHGKARLSHFIGWSHREAMRHKGVCLLSLVAILVQVVTGMTLPIGMKLILDDVVPTADLAMLRVTIAVMSGGALLFLGSRMAQDWAISTLCARILGRLRTDVFERLQRQSAEFFKAHEEGDILSRFGADLRELELATTAAVPGLLRQALKIAANGALLFFIEWRLALGVSLVLVLVLLAPRRLLLHAHRLEARRQEATAATLAVVQESLYTREVVSAFQLQTMRRRVFDGTVATLIRESVRSGFIGALASRLAGTAITIVQIAALAFGAWLVMREDLTLGLLVAFLGLLANVASAGQAALDALPMATRGAGNLTRVESLLRAPVHIADAPDAKEAPPLSESIRFDHVTFAYDEGAPPVLRDVSFTIRAGENVAIVGPSGSGKSTVLSLIMRQGDPQSGAVLYDGSDLRSLTEASVRRQTGVVLQQPSLFGASIRDNIRVGKLDADDREVEEAARLADAATFIEELPKRYDSGIGQRGGALSGGQRQRIAIARALIRDPRILVLDEATSALDPATEHEIGETLARIKGGRTVVSVTHRLRAAVGCERIFVMVGGEVVEQGSHAELLEQNGHYRRLWEKQGGIIVAPSGDHASVTPERLRRIRFLRGLSDTHLTELAQALVPERFRAGEHVFDEGDVGDRFYLIARGSLEAITHDDGGERLLTVMDDGDVFGEIAIVEQVPRTATIRARVPSLCMSLARDSFQRLLADYPELQREVLATISERLARSEEVRQSDVPSAPPPREPS